jgi:predicted deacylase
MDYLHIKLNLQRPWILAVWIALTLIICAAVNATEREENADPTAEAPATPVHPAQDLPGTEQSSWGPIEFLGRTIQPGSSSRLFLCPGEGFAPESLDIPVFVLHGSRQGPQLCAVAGTHGDELNGVEIVRHATDQIRPDQLAGTFIGVPIVNIHGFRRGSRYLPDRRDLNRYFPGNHEGSLASRMAARLFDKVIRYCDVVVDFHTGSFKRKNLVQIRVDFTHERALELARSFGSGLILHSSGPAGSLRRAAMDAGIIALLYEAGQPARFESEEIAQGIAGLHNLMAALDMLETTTTVQKEQLEFRDSRWVRADAGGIFLTDQKLGDTIWLGDILGTITDPITNSSTRVWSLEHGRILGMAVPQVVLPGFALFHVGIED